MDGRLADRVRCFTDRLAREDVNLYGFILSVNGEEKAKAYYAPMREGKPHRLYSVSKTLTGIAIGMLIDDGKLTLDSLIADFFRDWITEKTDERVKRLKIRDMLRMATCFSKTAYREGTDENWAEAFFRTPADHEPGTVFAYDTGNSQVLAALVRRLSGQEVMEFLEERLFKPLGCEDPRFWLRDPSGCCQGGTGLCMSLRDMHRIALCLADGGRGLIPGWFVEEMQRKHIETVLQDKEEERYGYGWQCWRVRTGWAMYGMGGQLAVICPEKQAVLSTIADTRLDPQGVQRIYNAFFDEVYPYLGTEDTAPVRLNLAVRPLEDRAEIAGTAEGEYCFPEGNALGLKHLRMDRDCVRLENTRGDAAIPFRRGEILETAFPGWPEVPALISAGWLEDGLLRVRCFAVGDSPCGFDMLIHIRENRATVQSRCSSGLVTGGYQGFASGYRKAEEKA